MVSLAGLSAAFPGYQKARESGSQSDVREFELQKGQSGFKALDAAGNALLQLADIPGAQPLPGMGMGGGPPVPPGGAPGPATAQGAPPPQPPMQPGQPSVPMAPASWAPGGAFPAAGGGMLQGGNQRLSQALQGAQPQSPPQGAPGPAAPPQAGPPPGMGGGMPQPQGQIDLRSFIAAVKQRNPNISGTEMAQAVIQMLPVFNQQSREMLQALNLQMRQQGLDVREDIARLNASVAQRGQDIRAATTERGQDIRAQMPFKLEDIRQQHRIELAKERLQIKQDFGATPTITDQTAELYARRIIKGQKGVMAELGTGAIGAANKAVVANTLSRIAAEENISPEQFVANGIQLLGRNQMARTAGQIGARIDQAAYETEALIPQARQALQVYDQATLRTQYPTFNAFVNATNEQLGSKELVDLKLALLGLSRAYASSLNRGYQPTVDSQKTAHEAMSEAWNTGQLETAFKRIQTEVDNVRAGNQRLMRIIGSPESGFGTQTGGQQAPVGGSSGQPTQQMKPMDDTARQRAQGALKRGWTLDQIKEQLAKEGYDTSTINAPTRQPDL